jgi:hypothetical protein
MVHAFHMSGDSDNTASNGQLHFAVRVMIRYLLIGAWSTPSSEAYLLAPIPHGLAWKSGLWATCDCGKQENKTCINMSSLGRQQTKHPHLSITSDRVDHILRPSPSKYQTLPRFWHSNGAHQHMLAETGENIQCLMLFKILAGFMSFLWYIILHMYIYIYNYTYIYKHILYIRINMHYLYIACSSTILGILRAPTVDGRWNQTPAMLCHPRNPKNQCCLWAARLCPVDKKISRERRGSYI